MRGEKSFIQLTTSIGPRCVSVPSDPAEKMEELVRQREATCGNSVKLLHTCTSKTPVRKMCGRIVYCY